MTKTATAHVNLASIVHESEQAAREAAAAVAKANAAQRRALAAEERAAQERDAANRRYLELLQREQPEARKAALTAQGEKRAALEAAVREGGDVDVFCAYRAWVEASIHTWEVDSALQQQRHYHGQPSRETDPPRFNFATDVAAIVDRLSLELGDEARERIRDRKARFLRGEEG